MSSHSSDIRITAKVGVDPSEAESGLRRLQTLTERAAEEMRRHYQEGGYSPPGMGGSSPLASERARSIIGQEIGSGGSYIQNRKKITSLIGNERQKVRDLEEQYRRLDKVTDEHGKSQKAHLQAQIKEHTNLARAMKVAQDAGEVVEANQRRQATFWERLVKGGGVRGGTGGNMTFSQAAKGGMLGGMLGSISRLVMSNPLTALAAGVGGAAIFGYNKADEAAQYSEGIQRQYLGTARRTGAGLNLGGRYYQRGGRIDQRFLDMGISGEEAARMVSAYSMPGMTVNDTLDQGAFAKKYGFPPEMISAMGRRVTQLGGAEPGHQGQFWRQMAAAVEIGQKNGIDASETVKQQLTFLEQTAKHTGVVSKEYMAGFGGLSAAFGGTGGRFFKGELGGQHLGKIFGGLAHQQTLGQQAAMFYAVSRYFGGIPQTGEEVGLEGVGAKAYETLPSDIIRAQSIQARLPEMLTSKNRKTRMTASGILQGLSDYGGAHGQTGGLVAMELFGMGPEELRQAKASLLKGGYGGRNVLEQLSKAAAKAATPGPEGESALDVIKATGLTPKKGREFTAKEKFPALDQANKEQISQIVATSKALVEFRTSIKDMRATAQSFIGMLGEPGESEPHLTGRGVVGQKNRLPAEPRVPSGHGISGRRGVPADESMAEALDRLFEQYFGKASPQAFHGRTAAPQAQPIALVLSGHISVDGDGMEGSGRIPATHMVRVLTQQITDALERERNLFPSHPTILEKFA